MESHELAINLDMYEYLLHWLVSTTYNTQTNIQSAYTLMELSKERIGRRRSLAL